MANYTAADIKALRERTGAGMMDVKKALDEANGDAEKAIEIIRIKGLKGATKREGRSTAEGLVAAKVTGGVGVMIEVNCETDFVAKADKFIQLADKVLNVAVESGAADLDTLLATEVDGKKLADVVIEEAQSSARRLLSAVSPALREPRLTLTCTRPPRTSRPRSAFCSLLTAKAKPLPPQHTTSPSTLPPWLRTT